MSENQITFPCIMIDQPIGSFYIGVISSRDLYRISYSDIRRMENEKRDVETYLGIQRPLLKKRVNEISEYVKTVDACFPTSIILAIKSKYAEFDKKNNVMTLSHDVKDTDVKEFKETGKIAKVLDGQHRIAGLSKYEGKPFNLNVSIFVDIDIEEQAYIFSTVNVNQTKIHRSLLYDLYDFAKSPSPQKSCHQIAVNLNSLKESPFYHRIKRLGSATLGRDQETITQATFVQSLIKYFCKDKLEQMSDRDLYKKGKVPKKINSDASEKLIFRNMMIDKRDNEITDVIWNYFDAVRKRWPEAWKASGRGNMLNKTNGFKALMRFLRDAYLFNGKPGDVLKTSEFMDVFNRVKLNDKDFIIDTYKPGTSGESKLYNDLKSYLP